MAFPLGFHAVACPVLALNAARLVVVGLFGLAIAGAPQPIFGAWVDLNPFTWIFGGYRDLLYYGRAPDWASLALCGLASVPVTLVALYAFKRMSPSFVKVL